jgi:hypothetical protein
MSSANTHARSSRKRTRARMGITPKEEDISLHVRERCKIRNDDEKQIRAKRRMPEMRCNAMQCNAMQCNAMQCNAMQPCPMIHKEIACETNTLSSCSKAGAELASAEVICAWSPALQSSRTSPSHSALSVLHCLGRMEFSDASHFDIERSRHFPL